MFCGYCGTRNGNGASFCHNCGSALGEKRAVSQSYPVWQQNFQPATAYAKPHQSFQQVMTYGQQQGFQSAMANTRSQRSRGTAAALALFLGTFGAHRFYAGKTGSAVIMLVLTLIGIVTSLLFIGVLLIATTGIWAVIDFFIIVCGGMKDANGNTI